MLVLLKSGILAPKIRIRIRDRYHFTEEPIPFAQRQFEGGSTLFSFEGVRFAAGAQNINIFNGSP